MKEKRDGELFIRFRRRDMGIVLTEIADKKVGAGLNFSENMKPPLRNIC